MGFRERSQQGAAADSTNRYCRATIRFDDDEVSGWPEVSPSQAMLMANAVAFNPKAVFPKLPPVQRCIYCDSTVYASGETRPLGAEHVIPEGLGGTMELPQACCRKHEGLTSSIEGSVLRHHLLPVRRQMKLHGKKRNRDGVTVTFKSLVDGGEIEIRPALDEHPTVLVLPRLHPPGMMFPHPGLGGISFRPLVPFNKVRESGIDNFVAADLDMLRFCQLLAKIAHSYAAAMIGEDMFVQLLRPLITMPPAELHDMKKQCYLYVGGVYNLYLPSSNLHEVDITFNQQGDKIYIVVYIRLFANLAGPLYIVAACTVPDGTSVEEIFSRMVARKGLPNT